MTVARLLCDASCEVTVTAPSTSSARTTSSVRLRSRFERLSDTESKRTGK